MANFNSLTASNGAITDLRALLFETLYNEQSFREVITPMTKVLTGQKMDAINGMGAVGKTGHGCNPDYESVVVDATEKTWTLGDWQLAKKICYTELESTIAKHGLTFDNNGADIRQTPYWSIVIEKVLTQAITQMFWRLVWFGDTGAKHKSAGGVITNSADVELMKPCDGLFKHLFAIASSDTSKKTSIAANAKATYAEQISAIRTTGVATGIINDVLYNADSRISDQDGAALYMTNAMFKALREDLRKTSNLNLSVSEITKGINVAEYDGVKIIALDVWDRVINEFENTGTDWNNPLRVVFTAPSNLLVGTSASEFVDTAYFGFDDKQRENFIFAESNIGTLVAHNELVHIAY